MTTLARPYAIAAFEYASVKNELPAWEVFLDAAALITADAAVQALLTNPSVTSKQIMDLYVDVLAKLATTEMKNFIHLLTQNHRLRILPGIAELFKSYRAAQEKKLTVQVVSAISLSPAYNQKLVQALTKRLRKQVTLECSVDESLLGGARITAGDLVIDGSVRGKLDRMIEFISGIS